MIKNDDDPGNYRVRVFANTRAVASFQCPTLNDAWTEIARIGGERRMRGLPTSKATIQRVVGQDIFFELVTKSDLEIML